MTQSPRDPLAHLHVALEALANDGRLRVPPPPTTELTFCSNDYLGLADRPAPHEAAGAGASRLVVGEHPAHGTLERALADWLGVEKTLLFSSGYAANLGTLAALAAPEDVIVSDEFNHASIIDGARLSRARVVVTRHNDVEAVDAALARRDGARAWVAVESYFSMDADGPDLGALRATCDRHGAALFVDEAHALGVLGPNGRGRCAEAGIVPDVLVGTLGKAFGGQGAFVGGSAHLRAWLWNRARSFVFSTGLAPVTAHAAATALETIREAEELRRKVDRLARRMRSGLAGSPNVEVIGFGHVIPIVVGDSHRAVTLSKRLAEEGLAVPPIRPPTVPEGGARIRLTVTARHEDADIDRAVAAIRRAAERLG